MTTEKKKYTPEFKKEAVRLVTEQGYKTSEAARNLGIHPSVLNRWKQQLASDGQKAFPGVINHLGDEVMKVFKVA